MEKINMDKKEDKMKSAKTKIIFNLLAICIVAVFVFSCELRRCNTFSELRNFQFQLMDENKHEDNPIYDHLHNKYGYPTPSVRILFNNTNTADILKNMIDTCDLTKRKCYITGEVGTILIDDEAGDRCCFTVPSVYLNSINDINFDF
jgi:hypothetical protein